MRPSERTSASQPRPAEPDPQRPRLTPRWVRAALLEARMAFEDEMERERKRQLDREFERFWRARHARGEAPRAG